MSIKLMSRVWEKQLTHSEQTILLAMADYADDNGRNCYPSYDRLAWKTGYGVRQVARIIKGLCAKGIVVVVKPPTQHNSAQYWIRIEKAADKPPYGDSRVDISDIQSSQNVQSENIQSSQMEHPGWTFETSRVVKMSTDPLVTTNEPSKGERKPPPSPEQLGKRRPEEYGVKVQADLMATQRDKLGISAAQLTELTNAILDGNGKRAMADLQTDMGEREASQARECALSLAAMGHVTGEAISVLFGTWKTHDWRGAKGETPTYRQLIEHAAALPDKVKAVAKSDGALTEDQRGIWRARVASAKQNVAWEEKMGRKPSARDLKTLEEARRVGAM